jgi:hypothetical protein
MNIRDTTFGFYLVTLCLVDYRRRLLLRFGKSLLLRRMCPGKNPSGKSATLPTFANVMRRKFPQTAATEAGWMSGW